jgi:hypothetical protein
VPGACCWRSSAFNTPCCGCGAGALAVVLELPRSIRWNPSTALSYFSTSTEAKAIGAGLVGNGAGNADGQVSLEVVPSNRRS